MGKRKIKEIPKKSKMITGYIIYASEIRREIIRANPGKDFGDISKIVGIEWRKLGQEEKVMFEKRAEEQNSLFRDEFSKMSETSNESIANAQSAPALLRPSAAGYAGAGTPTDLLLQQQQQQQQAQQQQQQQAPPPGLPNMTPQVPFSLVQYSQPTTTVQYCNNPACCATGRYQPYPTYPYSPPEPPVTPSSVHQQAARLQSPPIKLSPTHHIPNFHQQLLQQQQQQAQTSHLFEMNNIIYRKPSLVKLRPRDVGTQTDPVPWAAKMDLGSPKKLNHLRHSKEFIQHLRSVLAERGSPAKITAECHW